VKVDAAVVGVALRVESQGSLLERTGWLFSVQPTPSGVGTGGGLDEDQGKQLTSAGSGVYRGRRPELASLAGRLVPSGGVAPWATLLG
jgi:hypothetical protein